MFLTMLIGSSAAMCLSLLMIQVELSQVFFCSLENLLHCKNVCDLYRCQAHSASVVLLDSLFLGLIAVFFVFVSCEINQRAEIGFNIIDETIGQLDWYRYPNNVQRMMVPVLIYAQKPAAIMVFGSISCDRAQFKKV